jgi:hypothetical protein
VKFTSYKNWINEKFVENDTDPIKDMGIGIKNFWKNEKERIDKMSVTEVYEQYFREFMKSADASEKFIFKGALYITLLSLSEGKSPNTAFKFACKEVYITDRLNIHTNRYRRIIAKVLKEHFFIDVTQITERANEKFKKEESDSIEDMKTKIEY